MPAFHDADKDELPQPNINYVKDAIKKSTPYLRKGDLVILESTSPIGTTELIRDLI